MSLNASWAPTNASAADIWGQRSLLDGILVASVGYGVHLTLFFLCFNMINSRTQKTYRDWMMLAYITTIFILGTIGNALNAKFSEMVFIDDINFPGGPNAFNVEESSIPIIVVCNSVYIVNLWFQDGLLLYRFYIIYQRNLYAMIVPTLIYITDIVLACLMIAQLSRPDDTIWSKVTSHLAITYWSLSISFNVILTVAIVGRLLLVRRRLHKIYGPDFSNPFVSISAMLIESACLYTCNGLIYIVSFGLNSNVQNLAVGLLGQTQSIAPLMIVLRVAQGKAWSPSTAGTLSSETAIRSASPKATSKPSSSIVSINHAGEV